MVSSFRERDCIEVRSYFEIRTLEFFSVFELLATIDSWNSWRNISIGGQTLWDFLADSLFLGDNLLSAICAVDTVIATPSTILVSVFPNPRPESVSFSSSSTFFNALLLLLLCFFSLGIKLKLGSRPCRVRLPRLDSVSYDLVRERAWGIFIVDLPPPWLLAGLCSSSLALPESM